MPALDAFGSRSRPAESGAMVREGMECLGAERLERGGGLIHSQQVLLALTQKGIAREDAYRLVQRNAMRAFRGEGSFLAYLKADQEVSAALSSAELDALFDTCLHMRNVDAIFERVFNAK